MPSDSGELIARSLFRGASTVLFGALLLMLPAASAAEQKPPLVRAGTSKIVSVPIEGICSAGLADIREGLAGVSGIGKIEGGLTGESVEVTFAPQKVSSERIVKMIAELGYRTGPAKTR